MKLKKMIPAAIAAALVLALVACSKNSSSDDNETKITDTSVTEATSDSEEANIIGVDKSLQDDSTTAEKSTNDSDATSSDSNATTDDSSQSSADSSSNTNSDSTTSDSVTSDSSSDEAWKTEFEKNLLDNYGVTPDHYEDLGDGLYQVYVEIDGNVIPYVVVDSATGEFHG